MKASEAEQITRENFPYLEDVFEHIKNAAKKGEGYTTFDGYSAELVKELEDLGYYVSVGSNLNKDYYLWICWMPEIIESMKPKQPNK
jgi:hypothetical protein